MTNIYVPSNSPDEWREFLADPVNNWRTGFSAKALAYAWMEDSDNFPHSVRSVFRHSQIELFKNIEMLLAFPEYKTPLPGGARPSQSDVFVIAKSMGNIVSVTVEGKVSEPFGELVSEWKSSSSLGRQKRLQYLCDCLGLDLIVVDTIRYQLLHRTAAALIEADRFNASSALMLVHSFSQTNEGFEDFRQFASLFGVQVEVDSITYAPRPYSNRLRFKGRDLYLGWVRGNEKYLLI